MTNSSVQLTVRVPAGIVEALDTWIATQDQRVAGARFSRTTLLRDLLVRHLNERRAEGEYGHAEPSV
jgi:hypothetical protein